VRGPKPKKTPALSGGVVGSSGCAPALGFVLRVGALTVRRRFDRVMPSAGLSHEVRRAGFSVPAACSCPVLRKTERQHGFGMGDPGAGPPPVNPASLPPRFALRAAGSPISCLAEQPISPLFCSLRAALTLKAFSFYTSPQNLGLVVLAALEQVLIVIHATLAVVSLPGDTEGDDDFSELIFELSAVAVDPSRRWKVCAQLGLKFELEGV
jgi:hypothetical protein